MIKARFRKDLRALEKLEKRVPEQVGARVEEAAEALIHDIRSSWSPSSPSSPGEPPAVVSGDLDAHISIRGRDARGRFASRGNLIEATVVFWMYYAPYLEEGTSKMRPRPFIDPAVGRLEGVYATFFQEIFR